MRAMNIDGIGMTSQRTRERLIRRLIAQGIKSRGVLDAIRTTPRHIFVDEALSHRAYEDTALPIGHNQTLSQPYIVARMTEALLGGGSLNNVLEIGTGSGYQTAILAKLVKRVYSIERIKSLQDKARERLRLLSVFNTQFKMSDGSTGWASTAPFDGILVAAAPTKLPVDLLSQLSPEGGRMVIPVGEADHQELVLVIRDGERFRQKKLEPVRFVPMLSGVIRDC
ncbi:protein-L-isoaspartate(D-aspartate) O-methyltransferase [Endozoicomonas sp. Mp262]|uniref:protein-L-isoaspartate(D-aspartate) O-methyltransferase n=1 Tax=Endozoicomonas sp. Mp262 TaxID=2919499 RepID=UPI0021D8863A